MADQHSGSDALPPRKAGHMKDGHHLIDSSFPSMGEHHTSGQHNAHHGSAHKGHSNSDTMYHTSGMSMMSSNPHTQQSKGTV